MHNRVISSIQKRLAAARVSEKTVQSWLEKWTVFFVLGYGRSGTAFLSELLNKANGAHVFHEPVLEDFYAHLRAHYQQRAAESYIRQFRIKEICSRMQDVVPGVYGEVTSTLRCHAAAIRSVVPGAIQLHLVRDGRDVVRSAMARGVMTTKHPLSLQLHPTVSDPWYAEWPNLDPFGRACWLWQEENRRLRLNIERTVQFEKLLATYEYFQSELLAPCHIHVERQDWEAASRVPKNATTHHQLPRWQDWSREQRRMFDRICGVEMAACGYQI